MSEEYGDRPVSHASLMEMQEDREVMEGGYQFLDEKLVLLAQELLARLEAYERLRDRFRELEAGASAALAAAVGRHGLEGVQVYPPVALARARLRPVPRDFLGVRLLRGDGLEMEAGETGREEPVRPSAEAEQCAGRYRALTEAAAGLALEGANLRRLLAEYRRTEQRAKALDNVALPEVRRAEERMRAQLEEAEQEEAVRVRLFIQGHPG